MRNRGIRILLYLAICTALTGCRTPGPGLEELTVQDAAELAQAKQLLDQGNYTEALITCIDLSRRDPRMPGLDRLQHRISVELAEQRARSAARHAAQTHRRMDVDIEGLKGIPDTYRLRRDIRGETEPMRTPPSAMEEVLQKPVTVHLDGVNLNAFILAMGASENVNIIADALDDTQTMTIHAEDVPLAEILDYVSRNLGVQFSVGRSLIWATPGQSTEEGIPLETRMYRLRKGISSEELQSGDGRINIVEAIERFVPPVTSADLLFDTKAHVLICRNTRANLGRIEDIIEALDVCPPQVLIEARFISTSVSDLRELGIDWVLNSPISISTRDVVRDGSVVGVPRTQIDQGATVGFAPFANETQGLNLSYQGLLTDPMFKAVLHALDISGKSRTLSVPKITTVNNRPANMRIGEDFRYFEEYDVQETLVGTTDQGGQIYRSEQVPVGTPELEELGIALQVTPSVGADRSNISLHIVPEISDFVRWEFWEVGTDDGGRQTGQGSSGNISTNGATSSIKLPIFRRSTLETEVIVQSGETVVMGGLITSAESKTKSQVPVLSSLPFIGKLFQHDNVEETRQNLLIFVTATILSQRGEDLIPIASPRETPEVAAE